MSLRSARVLSTILSLVVGGACLAQTIRLENLSPVPFTGWKRTTIDTLPPYAVGNVGGATYVVGRQIGLETWAVDVRISLGSFQATSLNLATAVPAAWSRGPCPANPMAWFGGVVSVGGQTMSVVALGPDGAGYTAQLRKRTGTMLSTEVWITWYPDQPGWAHGEAIVACSNPAVPDMGATAPANHHLRFGDAMTVIPGAGIDVPLVAAGTWFADGQMRAMPVTFVWPRLFTSTANITSAAAAASLGIGAVGIGKVLADGNPRYPAGFAARPWTLGKLLTAAQRLHS